jgi:glycosyltransferase involved in cell wall biosynthesis
VDIIGNIPAQYRVHFPGVKYHGQLTKEEAVKEILSCCDVLVCPSWSEGMPLVVMEAMACGLAIIATDVGAMSLLVDAQNGWLLDTPDPESIYNAMKEAMVEHHRLDAMKKNSSDKIKGFLFDKVTAVLIDKINKILPPAGL